MLYAWNFDIKICQQSRVDWGTGGMDANPFLVADQKRREATGTRSARDGAIARTRKRRSLTHTGSFHARRAAAGHPGHPRDAAAALHDGPLALPAGARVLLRAPRAGRRGRPLRGVSGCATHASEGATTAAALLLESIAPAR